MLAMVMNGRVVPDAGEHGVQREADKHGDQHGGHDGDAELVKELADDAAHKANGQEYGDDGQRGGQHGQANFLRTFQCCLIGVLAHLHMAHDVFAHHDGVINQQTHTQRQCHQRDHVDGKAEPVHEEEGADQRDGQRQPRDHGGAPGVQEQKHDEHREYGPFNQRLAHVLHPHANGARVIGNGLQSHARRQLRSNGCNGCVQAIDHFDGVFVLGLLHGHQQGAAAVVQGQRLQLCRIVLHASELTHPNGRAIAVGDDDAGKLVGALNARINLHHALLRHGADRSHGQVLVFGAHCLGHLLGGDGVGLQCLRVQVDVDLALGRTHQVHGSHAAYILQPLFQHLIGPAGQRNGIGRCDALAVWRFFSVQGMRIWQHGQRPHCRAGRVKANDTRLLDLVTQSGAHGRDFLAHVIGCPPTVDVQLKLDDDDTRAFVAARGQGVDTRHRVDGLFNLLGDFALHDLWGGTGVLHAHHDHGEFDIRELIDLESLVRKHPQHHKGQHEHGGQDGVFQTDAREPHLLAPAVARRGGCRCRRKLHQRAFAQGTRRAGQSTLTHIQPFENLNPGHSVH